MAAAPQIVTELNAALKTATSGEITSFLTSITVTPSEYVSGEYTAQFVLGQSTGLPSAVFAAGQDAAIQSVFGSTTSVRATRWSGTGPSHTAENAAAVDAVTEVGIACPGLTHGGYATDGAQANATIARWQVTGAPGYVLQYAPDNPLRANVDHLIGTDVSDLTLALVDQHGTQLTTLLGEHWSTILCIEVGY